ncbi:hypothetical protein [Roseococcus sp. YIM B11640]|uniref:hypothetical protein n=1 Tax=Roseococcus sp. YIM B11640 TaxID=3133973 RepID=UPI003C7A21D7
MDWRLLPGGRTYEATLSARRDGPLFLYVNDLLVPGIAETYGNNCGTARLRVRLLGGVEGGAEAEGGAMREIPLPPNYGRGNPACTTSRGGAPPSQ